ncbi:MAG TPA: ribonuclease H-like domain-containing protein [Candidatus Acidoferrales bacterium]|nr:ribonuclease H-like domain-containing protein [Candidatus Acidoferrales bacterium]
MASIFNDAFGDRLARVAALRPARGRVARNADMEADDSLRHRGDAGELARLLGATVTRNRYGEHLLIRQWYSTPEPCLTENDSRAERVLRLLLPKAAKSKCDNTLAQDPNQWLFLDTETTGLAGGSGMYAFLVGVAWWESGGLQVEQFFMRDYDEEHALLETLRERMHERRVLVTFNGKTFDWPLLDTRYRMTRSIQPAEPAVHLDFLHPARQLWRPRLTSVRLAELERHVLRVSRGSRLDWTRDADVDSSLIPLLYFNFVRAAVAEPLVPVFRHNQMDLRGLAAIAGRVVEMLAGCTPETAVAAEEPSEDAMDIYGLARLLERRGEPALARNTYRAALAAGLPQRFERAARRDLAKLSKRAGDLPQAAELWESLLDGKRADADKVAAISQEQSLTLERIPLRGIAAAGEDAAQLRDTLEACEQLAIYFEHHTKAIRRASQVSDHALALLRRSRVAPRQSRRFEDGGDFRGRFETRFAHRLARLVRKANRADSLLSGA